MEKLAINGGTPVKKTPFATGKRYDAHEQQQVAEVFANQSLSYWSKYKVNEFVETVKRYFNVPYCAGGSSGSAALHAAVGALELAPGTEVITSPITDMGTLIGIIYQNLVPVFADVDPRTYNITADTIKAVMTKHTGAIIVVHLAGTPCEMGSIMELAREHSLPVIEDCAQAYGAEYRGQKAGTIGSIGAFSLNESKHISCGDGGFAITSDEKLYVGLHNYLDKYYDRLSYGNRLAHVAPCYRLSEMQYAVATAQFGKLPFILEQRRRHADNLNMTIRDIPGILAPIVPDNSLSSWWFYMFRIQPDCFTCEPRTFVESVKAEGIPAALGYLPRPIYLEPLFVNKSFFPGGIWPAELAAGRKYQYVKGLCPDAELVLDTTVRLLINEFHSASDIRECGLAIQKVAAAFMKK